MKIAIRNFDNEEVGELDLPEEVFGYPFNEHLIHAAVVACRAAQRSGSHKVKTRSEVRGSNRKPWRQKGTGRARHGEIRSPLWRTGGVVHGPRPRSHEKGTSANEKKTALKSALSRKVADDEIVVLDSFELDEHKTRGLVEKLSRLGVDGKALLVDRHDNRNLTLAARNNPRVKTVDALAVNVYDVVDRHHLVISRDALDRLTGVLTR